MLKMELDSFRKCGEEFQWQIIVSMLIRHLEYLGMLKFWNIEFFCIPFAMQNTASWIRKLIGQIGPNM
jgi:hypothetical protein